MKIKNTNDLLGYLIKNADSQNEISIHTLLSIKGNDNYSINKLLKDLSGQGYISYDSTKVTVYSLGRNNYESIPKKIAKTALWVVIELIVYFLGIASGVAVTLISAHYLPYV